MTARRVRMFLVLATALVSLLVLVLATTSLAGAAPASDAAKGKTAFDRNCMPCHGEAGKGGIGPPLAKDIGYFVSAGVPTQLFGPLLTQPVRQRPPGAKMPAFAPDKLSDADIVDIADYLASLTPAPTAPPKLGTAEAGAKPYADNCAACHGAKGEGGAGPPVAMMAAGMKAMGAPPNVMLGFVNLATRSGALPNMPTFGTDKLSEAQAADIAAYIWSIAPAGPPPGAAAGGPPPAAAAKPQAGAPPVTALPKTGGPAIPYPALIAAAALSLLGGILLQWRARRP